MAIAALVMAGGKASRMNSREEKPLLDVGGKPMIERVVEALDKSRAVDRVIVAVTNNESQTARMARELRKSVVLTPGEGYESDMKFAIKAIGLGDTLVVSADLPFISAEIVSRAVESYRSSRKPALSVMTPTETYERLASKPQYVFSVGGRALAPIGINIVDGKRIDEGVLEEHVLVVESEELALNVNTPEDLELARKLASNRSVET